MRKAITLWLILLKSVCFAEISDGISSDYIRAWQSNITMSLMDISNALVRPKAEVFRVGTQNFKEIKVGDTTGENIKVFCGGFSLLENIYPLLETTDARIFRKPKQRMAEVLRMLKGEFQEICDVMNFGHSAWNLNLELSLLDVGWRSLQRECTDEIDCQKIAKLRDFIAFAKSELSGGKKFIDTVKECLKLQSEVLKQLEEHGLSPTMSSIAVFVAKIGAQLSEQVADPNLLQEKEFKLGTSISLELSPVLLSLSKIPVTLAPTSTGIAVAGSKKYVPIKFFDFVTVEPGIFRMGSPEDEPGRQDNERLHTEEITRPYEIQTTEVTEELWEWVMRTHKRRLLSQHPRRDVSWEDAQEFVNKLNILTEKENYLYRLPTEVEWECAARAGTETAEFFEQGLLSEYAVYIESWVLKERSYLTSTTSRVASLKPNPWGLYDIYGNVNEWVDGDNGEEQVIRGGGWFDIVPKERGEYNPYRSAWRMGLKKNQKIAGLGFRLARELKRSFADGKGELKIHTEESENLGTTVSGVGLGPDFQFVKVSANSLIHPPRYGEFQAKPFHTSVEQSFEIQTTVLTQEVYEKISGKNPSKFKHPRNPVTNLSYYDILEMLVLLNRWTNENCHYSIPTSAQWQLGIAGTRELNPEHYVFTDNINELKEYVWFSLNSAGRKNPQPVALKKPNQFGIYDPLGNVWQITLPCSHVSGRGCVGVEGTFDVDYARVLESISKGNLKEQVSIQNEYAEFDGKKLLLRGGDIFSGLEDLGSYRSHRWERYKIQNYKWAGIRLIRTCKGTERK